MKTMLKNKMEWKKIKYLHSSPLGLMVKKLVDHLGYYFFNRNKDKEKFIIRLNEIRSIAIVNLGHIGDILLMLPMLDALRENYNGKIILLVNPYVFELAKKIKMVDEVYCVPHPRFSRTNNGSWFETFKVFRSLKTDIVFVADVYFFSIPFAYISRKKYFIGYNPVGFGFLFDLVLDYPYNMHITEKYYRFLDLLDIKRPKLKILTEYLYDVTNPLNDKDYIVIAVGTGAQAKDWDDENFIELINLILYDEKIIKNKKIVLLGKMEEERYRRYKIYHNDQKVIDLINRTTITEAIGIIKDSTLFVGLDSGLTHASAMLGIKTIALYSGTTGIGVWDPLNFSNNVDLIRVDNLFCNNNGHGCGKRYCKTRICMNLITPLMVYNKICKYLKGNG
jgi:heptosyltransferase-2